MKTLISHITINGSITCRKEYAVTKEDELFYFFIGDGNRELFSPKSGLLLSLVIKEGDNITFYTCCNSDRKLFTGVVQNKEQLGLITIVDDVQYEIKKLVDIRIVTN